MINDVILGDCLEVIKDIPDKSIDFICTDLPFQITACKWDTLIPFDKLWPHYDRIIKENRPIVLFGSEPFSSLCRTSNIKNYKYDWVWDKKKPSNFPLAKIQPMKYHENIMVFNSKIYYPIMVKVEGRQAKKGINNGARVFNKGLERKDYLDKVYTDKYPSSILEISNADQTNRFHPTQKPIKLYEYLINTYTKEGDLILDSCAGSGNLGLAAKNLNRNFILIEKEKEYYDVIIKRLNG